MSLVEGDRPNSKHSAKDSGGHMRIAVKDILEGGWRRQWEPGLGLAIEVQRKALLCGRTGDIGQGQRLPKQQ